MGRVVAGMTAPPLRTRDSFGTPLQLADYGGERLMLSFYRYASCPLCNLRLHDLMRRYPIWQRRGLRMVAVFESLALQIRRYLDRHAAPFPIVPDPERRLYRGYGVQSSWAGFLRAWTRHLPMVFDAVVRKGFMPGNMDGDWAMLPADFLIGPDLCIEDAFYGNHIGDHIPVERIERILDGSPPQGTTIAERDTMSTSTQTAIRIDFTPASGEEGDVDAIMQPFVAMLGRAPTGLRMLGTSPALLENYASTIHYYMSHAGIGQPLLTFIRYLVSWRGDCSYCVDLNEAFLMDAALDLDAIGATRGDANLAPLDERDKALPLLAIDAVDQPESVTKERIDSMRTLGWEDATSSMPYGMPH